LSGAAAVAEDIVEWVASQGFLELPITFVHGALAPCQDRTVTPLIGC
jgi:hypothetical protein